MEFRRRHGRRVRVATKYLGLTRRFFAKEGVMSYRIVESLGATEGAPAAGLAELIVDITTTGATLKANGLRILDDGVILRSQANLVRSRTASWSSRRLALAERLRQALRA
jgi:ATP phosphoribosyltransferase